MSSAYQYNLGIRFEQVAAEHAARTAIRLTKDCAVTYDLLNRTANRTARYLLDQGVSAYDVVCISGEKSLDTFALMLACLKIGAAYSILDPDSPVERLRKILSTCLPRLVASERELASKLEDVRDELSSTLVEKNTNAFQEAVSRYSDDNLPQTRLATGANPAYIMYTSGSTGFPKGAVMSHANVLNLIAWSRETYRITPGDILTNVNPLYFDNSVFDFYSALFNGASLVPFSKDEVRDPGRLVGKIDTLKCTLWFSVPSLLIFLQTMKATDGKRLSSVRRFVFGGEGYPKAKLQRLFEAYKATAEFHNVYGPTECTCICSSYQITEDDFQDLQGLPPLGHIAPNFSYLILGDDDRPEPSGEVGELCLLGPQVGKGYYNDPKRTAAAFVRNPCNDRFHEIMYRTGDLARLDPRDGKLHIHGRKDNQIKHMGYRIELEEIENALHRIDGVSEAAALHTNTGGLSKIVAVVATPHQLDENRLRADLAQLIPDYMIPSAFYRECPLPKNANGKVDRKRLAEKYSSGGKTERLMTGR